MNWQEWVGLLFVIVLGVVGWKVGHLQHANVKKDDSIHLPILLKLIFGNPNADGVYNIRGIYFQMFVVIMITPFLFSDFGIITRGQAFRSLVVAMLIFPVLELLRYFFRKQ